MTGAGLHPDAARLVSGSAARRTQAELLEKAASDSKLSTLAVSKERSAGAHLVDEPGSGRGRSASVGSPIIAFSSAVTTSSVGVSGAYRSTMNPVIVQFIFTKSVQYSLDYITHNQLGIEFTMRINSPDRV